MRMRPNASFAVLSLGFAVLVAGCPTTYVVSGEGGAAAAGVGGAAGAAGAYATGGGGGYVAGVGGAPADDCTLWYPYDSYEYWTCVNGYGGASGAAGYGGAGGGHGCDPACNCDCYAGAGGAGGVGGGQPCAGGIGGGGAIGGAGGDPCGALGDPRSICSCYYGINNEQYYGCLNRYDGLNGGVGGAPADLCEHLPPWSVDHERCVAYHQSGGAGSYAGEGGGVAGGEAVDAGSPD